MNVVTEYEKDVLDFLREFHADFGLQQNKTEKPNHICTQKSRTAPSR